MIIVIGGNNIMKLIDKSVLVEWIKKEDKEMQPNKDWHFDEYTEGYVDALAKILSFVDTLEMKEIDLNKLGEIARHLIAVKEHIEDMRLDKEEWLMLEKIGYPERFKAQKGE
jgi:hypothetical protein